MNKDFDADKVRKILTEHPNLRIAFKAGLISRRLCKDMLGITKWEMDDLYVDLIRAGAIKVLFKRFSRYRRYDERNCFNGGLIWISKSIKNSLQRQQA